MQPAGVTNWRHRPWPYGGRRLRDGQRRRLRPLHHARLLLHRQIMLGPGRQLLPCHLPSKTWCQIAANLTGLPASGRNDLHNNNLRQYRDVPDELAKLFVAAERAGIDPVPHFREVAQLSSAQIPAGGTMPLSEMMSDFQNSAALPGARVLASTAFVVYSVTAAPQIFERGTALLGRSAARSDPWPAWRPRSSRYTRSWSSGASVRIGGCSPDAST
jgi:hypothetical protein